MTTPPSSPIQESTVAGSLPYGSLNPQPPILHRHDAARRLWRHPSGGNELRIPVRHRIAALAILRALHRNRPPDMGSHGMVDGHI